MLLGTAHCADLSQARSYDPMSLTSARTSIADEVDGWLNTSPSPNPDTASTNDDSFVTKDAAIGLIVVICILAVSLIVGGIGFYLTVKKMKVNSSKADGLTSLI